MPLALIALGLIAVVTAINGTFSSLVSQLEQDINGKFLYWVAAVLIIGSIGFIPGWKTPSRAFLLLVIIVIVLANGGLWQKLTDALQQGATQTPGAVPLSQINTAPAVGAANTADLSGLVSPAATAGNAVDAAGQIGAAASAGNIAETATQAAAANYLDQAAFAQATVENAQLQSYPGALQGTTGGAVISTQVAPGGGIQSFLNTMFGRIPLTNTTNPISTRGGY